MLGQGCINSLGEVEGFFPKKSRRFQSISRQHLEKGKIQFSVPKKISTGIDGSPIVSTIYIHGIKLKRSLKTRRNGLVLLRGPKTLDKDRNKTMQLGFDYSMRESKQLSILR